MPDSDFTTYYFLKVDFDFSITKGENRAAFMGVGLEVIPPPQSGFLAEYEF